ncbi:hypothetical protein NB859_028860 [Pseudomonas aeruginosa]|nr:hypothetical protein [Pseudomonas aeruginosa]MDE9363035.1 hypothetical protein [Pseudomonas aeruginosa]
MASDTDSVKRGAIAALEVGS